MLEPLCTLAERVKALPPMPVEGSEPQNDPRQAQPVRRQLEQREQENRPEHGEFYVIPQRQFINFAGREIYIDGSGWPNEDGASTINAGNLKVWRFSNGERRVLQAPGTIIFQNAEGLFAILGGVVKPMKYEGGKICFV